MESTFVAMDNHERALEFKFSNNIAIYIVQENEKNIQTMQMKLSSEL